MPSDPSILAAVVRTARDLEALLLPAACLGCERALRAADEARALCDGCRARLRPIAPPLCGRCGQPRDRWDVVEGRTPTADGRQDMIAVGGRRPAASGLPSCAFCAAWPDALGWARSAVWLDDGPGRELTHALKYEGWLQAAAPMAAAIARAAGAELRRADALVPIPLGRTRRRERGHNQAAVLADALSRSLGRPATPGLLARRRETRSQTSLAPDERRRNVAGAFVAAARCDGRRVVLVDDVLTTGATLTEAARTLEAAGATEVGAVTFARALVPA